MNREKHFHPLAALHLLRKTLLVYLLPLVQVLFDRNWDALRAALRQELVLLFFISAVCWAVYYGGRWQVDAEGTVHVSWRLGVRLDRAARRGAGGADIGAAPALPPDRCLPGGAVPVGQTKTITLYLTRQQAEELADVLLPVTDPLWHAPKGGEKLAFAVLGANGLSTLILWWLAIHQTQSYAPDAQTAALAQLGQLAALRPLAAAGARAWLLVLAGTLFCISLVRSALQAVHYTVWRTDTQLGRRGGLVRRYEMRLRLSQLNYATCAAPLPHGRCITARYLSRQGRAARSCPCSSGGRAPRCCGNCCPRWRSCPRTPAPTPLTAAWCSFYRRASRWRSVCC